MFKELDFELNFQVRWYRLCAEDSVLISSFTPGHAVVRPYPWSHGVEWYPPKAGHRRRGRAREPAAAPDAEGEDEDEAFFDVGPAPEDEGAGDHEDEDEGDGPGGGGPPDPLEDT